MQDAQERHRERFGNVNPIIHCEFNGDRLVAVGNRIYKVPDKKATFINFLISYVMDLCGQQWWEAETAKSEADRHPLRRWFDHMMGMQEAADNGQYSAILDGKISAFLLLAYHLYVLQNHGKLQEVVLARVKQPDQFLGARYELLVASAFIRAGFDIAYEDESDTSQKHPEFVATHKQSGLVVAVEAKARHRPLVEDAGKARPKAGMRRLLNDAMKKEVQLPYIIFADLNLPPIQGEDVPDWIREVDGVLGRAVKKRDGVAPFDLVLFTNTPHEYGQAGEKDPTKEFAFWQPKSSRIPLDLVKTLVTAIQQYSNLPTDFPAA